MSKSTKKSMIQGKAYEYACLMAIDNAVSGVRSVSIAMNPSYYVAKGCFDQISDKDKRIMNASATAAIDAILKMEPRITEVADDDLSILLQPDNVAQAGDVRDIVIARPGIKWEIGISVKHNHNALKHSRLSSGIDFGKSWFNLQCSPEYFNEIKPVFDSLDALKKKGTVWANVPNKMDTVYVPVLNAFMNELRKLFAENNDIVTHGVIKYLLGSNGNDYYKLIHDDKKQKTIIIPFNLHNGLNKPSSALAPEIKIPEFKLSPQIVSVEYKPKSKTTVVMDMDDDWAISFRIHSASTKVEASLKFDIRLSKQPDDLFEYVVNWCELLDIDE
ncbi:MAG: HaeIII family restriction endonuclease [Alphaproteobacteria bacterium]|nr:HaeIII family restriction endonuclease [Alphaproteobacteria bacterium]